ncbi:NTF2-like protein [Gracilaria domingensis]|nr:NTF2-like protein [Gracilaria domingensis]
MNSAFLAPTTLLTHKLHRTYTKRCPARNYPVCRVAGVKPELEIVRPSHVVESLAERLRLDLQAFFDAAHPTDYSLYSTDFKFEDPLTIIRGVKKYEKHITFLERSILFSDAQFNLLDLRVIGDRMDTIRTRWYLSLTVNLPWRPCAVFTGQSDYVVDVRDEKICNQVDYWDSLVDSSFFSLPAVKDFVTQLVPNQPSLDRYREFDILRRTRDFEVRSFERNSGGVYLEMKNSTGRIPTWSRSKTSGTIDGVRLKNVAVMKLSGAPKSEGEFAESERMVRYLLSNVSFAIPGKTCIYVQEVTKGRVVHELWLDLVEANAKVNF